MAAGMSLPEANLPKFKAAFAAEIATRTDRESLAGVILSDGALSAGEISLDTARALRGGGPWGQGFPEPVFDGDFRIADVRIVGGKHLKMRLRMADAADSGSDPNATARDEPVEAIAFGYVGGAAEDPQLRGGARIQAAYRLEINEYLGSERLQLNCQHLRLI
jgi:single-stranded-DNA-specific exonuclease